MNIKNFELNEDSTLQDFLSIGYIFLLVLGIVKDSIYYHFLDIHILAYSSVLDVMLSPLVFLTRSFASSFVIVVMMVFMHFYLRYVPELHKKYRDNKWYQKMGDVEKWDKKYAEWNLFDATIKMCALLLISFFVGLGMGRGEKVAKKLKNKEFEANYELIFHNQDKKQVRIVGQNSQYIFYVLEKSDKILISPIQGNIMRLERLEKEKK